MLPPTSDDVIARVGCGHEEGGVDIGCSGRGGGRRLWDSNCQQHDDQVRCSKIPGLLANPFHCSSREGEGEDEGDTAEDEEEEAVMLTVSASRHRLTTVYKNQKLNPIAIMQNNYPRIKSTPAATPQPTKTYIQFSLHAINKTHKNQI